MYFDSNTPVSKLMTRNLILVSPSDTLDKVDQIFSEHTIHHIPVRTPEGKLVGMISKSDFLRVNHMLALFNQEKYGGLNQMIYSHMKAEEIMTTHPVILSPDSSLADAVSVFKENQIHALPIVEQGALVGILTAHDLLRLCFS